MRIVFLGCDGSGKTSLINYTKKKINRKNRAVRIVALGWKDFRNPILRFITLIYMKRKLKGRTFREKLKRFRERRWAFYFVYYLITLTRYLKGVFPKSEVTLMDRYFYDELVFAEGRKFKFFASLTPVPDKCFILKPSFRELKRRGLDISRERFDFFYKKMEKVKNLCEAYEIDSSGSPEKNFKKLERFLSQ